MIGVSVGKRPIAERFEIVLPFLANRNPALAVILPVGHIRVAAASSHVFPDAIEPGVPVAPGCAVFNIMLSFATAVAALASLKTSSDNVALSAAIATAQPDAGQSDNCAFGEN